MGQETGKAKNTKSTLMEINDLHNYELEAGVLGCMLEYPDAQKLLAPTWDESVFFKPSYLAIAGVISDLNRLNEVIDLKTVTMRLKASNRLEDAGGAYEVSKLTDVSSNPYHVETHYKKLQELKMLRRLAEIGHELKVSTIQTLADPFEIVSKFDIKLNSLTENLTRFNINQIGKLNDQAITRLENINSGVLQAGIYSGFDCLQRVTGGWQRTELTILAARPAMGKTALAIQFLLQPAIKFNIPTALFSIEMGDNPIVSRVQSILSGFSATNLIKGNVTKDDILSVKLATQSLNNLPIFVDSTPAISIFEFKQKARKLVKDKKVELIIIDYLQLMRAGIKGINREQEISTISRNLKETAKELNIPIIALSQLSRDVEKRGGNNRPQLSDLRDSGAIEQDADMVVFINRPEYYHKTEFEDGTDARGQAELIIAKNRNGATGYVKIGFEAHNVKFYDIETKNQMQPSNEF